MLIKRLCLNTCFKFVLHRLFYSKKNGVLLNFGIKAFWFIKPFNSWFLYIHNNYIHIFLFIQFSYFSLDTYLHIYLSIHLTNHLYILPTIYLSVYPSIYLFIYLFLYLCIYLSIHLSIYSNMCLFIYLSYLSIYLILGNLTRSNLCLLFLLGYFALKQPG